MSFLKLSKTSFHSQVFAVLFLFLLFVLFLFKETQRNVFLIWIKLLEYSNFSAWKISKKN